MTRFRIMVAAGALSLAAAATAYAQQSPPSQAMPDQPSTMGAPAQNQPAPSQDMSAPAQNPPTAPGQDMGAPAQNQPDAAPAAPSATSAGANTSAQVVNVTVTNGPIPDTPANRARFGGPDSLTGKHTKPAGN